MRPRLEEYELEASLSNILRPCFIKKEEEEEEREKEDRKMD